MKLNYHPETDSLYIDLSGRPSSESKEISEGIVLDYDLNGRLVPIPVPVRSVYPVVCLLDQPVPRGLPRYCKGAIYPPECLFPWVPRVSRPVPIQFSSRLFEWPADRTALNPLRSPDRELFPALP